MLAFATAHIQTGRVMSHPNKIKGSRFESDAGHYLGVKRIGAIYGNQDQGDLEDPLFVMECKNENRIDLAGYMDQLMAEYERAASKPFAVAIVKRRHRPIDDAYAVMPLWMFKRIRERLMTDDATDNGTVDREATDSGSGFGLCA